jgi:HEAT repeat protein
MTSLKSAETIPNLITLLDNGSENVKNAAVVALGEFNDERAVNALLGVLQDDQWIVFSAICSLGKTRHQGAVEPLLQIFQQSDEELSLAACEVLMDFEDDSILDKMFNILTRWSKKKRERYVEVIIQQGNEDLFEHLLTYVTFGKPSSIPVLRLMTHFKNLQTCKVLLENLKQIDPDEAEYDEVLQLFLSLAQVWKHNIKEYLCNGDEYTQAVVKACGLMNIRIHEDLLIASFLASSATARREIIKNADKIVSGKGYDLLKEAVKDQDGHVKSYAVKAIGTMKLKKLENDIVALAKEGFMDVRVNALKALIELDRDEAMQLLQQFVKTALLKIKRPILLWQETSLEMEIFH